jgi:probable F420-dependent oxidoreductase
MKFSAVFQTDPPAWRVVELSRLAEDAGFEGVWTFDSPILWQEPFVIYSQILSATSRVKVGPMVTNPFSRDWTVTASLFATLNEMFGNRMVCGIGRGDSSLRVVGDRPATLATLAEAMAVIKELAEGREITRNGKAVRIPWVKDGHLEVLMAAYGPKALHLAGSRADGLILQVADPYLVRWAIAAARDAAAAAGRDPSALWVCVAAPAYVGDDLAHQRDQVRWFGGMVGNHVADLVERYGDDSDAVPRALTDYIKDREGYDYLHHGRVGNPDTEFVPDAIVDRFCVLGTVDDHLQRMKELESLGVDEFAVYAMHDDIEATLQSYGDSIISTLSNQPKEPS